MNDHHATTVVTRIEQQKKQRHRYNIYINDQYEFSVHEDVLLKHRISKGMKVDPSHLQSILADEEMQKAFLQAIRFISRKLRSQKEIESKLQEKQYAPETIDAAIKKLKQQQYIDDREYATALTNYRIKTQKKGRRWVQQELQQKGLTKEHITQAMMQIDEEDEFNLARELAQKRWVKQDGSIWDKNRKTGAYLLRRGYTNHVVQKVLHSIRIKENSDEGEEYDDYNDFN